MQKLKYFAGLLLGISLASQRDALADSYKFTNIIVRADQPPQVVGMSDAGVLVNTVDGVSRDFRIYTPKGYTELATGCFTDENCYDGAVAINNQGQVLGDYYGNDCSSGDCLDWSIGALFKYGSWPILIKSPTYNPSNPLASFTGVNALNDNGEVVGSSGHYARNEQGYFTYVEDGSFVWNSGISRSLVDPSAANGSTFATKVNNKGQIIGFYRDPTSGVDRAFVTDGVSFQNFGVPGAQRTYPDFINDAGQIVGDLIYEDGATKNFLYQNGSLTGLNLTGNIVGFNDKGQIATDTIDRAFVYTNGNPVEIRYPGATSTSLNGIDDRGEIAGTYENASGSGIFFAVPTSESP